MNLSFRCINRIKVGRVHPIPVILLSSFEYRANPLEFQFVTAQNGRSKAKYPFLCFNNVCLVNCVLLCWVYKTGIGATRAEEQNKRS